MYTYEGHVLRVIDGDTYEIQVDLGFHMHKVDRFRIAGVDTPETWRPKTESEKEHGLKATQFVKDLIEGEKVVIETIKADLYGRYLCNIELDGQDLAILIIEAGFEKLENYQDD
jgi:micrococcal nuclease